MARATVTKPTFDTVIRLMDNGSWPLENIARQSGLKVSTIKAIRQAKTWRKWQLCHKVKSQKSTAVAKTVKVQKARRAKKAGRSGSRGRGRAADGVRPADHQQA